MKTSNKWLNKWLFKEKNDRFQVKNKFHNNKFQNRCWYLGLMLKAMLIKWAKVKNKDKDIHKKEDNKKWEIKSKIT